MNIKGYSVTGDQCDIKFRNLKKTYKRIKDNNNQTGTGAITWSYFEKFEILFGKKPDLSPVALGSSMQGYIMNEQRIDTPSTSGSFSDQNKVSLRKVSFS